MRMLTMHNSLKLCIILFQFIDLTASTQFDKPTLEQLQNTDTIKIYFKCTRDRSVTNPSLEHWLSIATANDKLIDDCYTSTDDDVLYEKVFDTIRFVLDQSTGQPNIHVNLMVAGETANKITHHILDGKEYDLVTQLNDDQIAQLTNLYNHKLQKAYSNAELETLLKHSLYFGVIESNSQKLVGFIRVITDYVSFAKVLDAMIDLEYQSKELEKLLILTVINHPKVAPLLTLQANYGN